MKGYHSTEWKYTTMQNIAALPGVKITATAADRPATKLSSIDSAI
jgi:hypothetical protein